MSFYLMHRGWMDNKLFSSVKRAPLCRRAVWIWMIEHAAFDGDDRGHLFHSVRYLAEAWGWPKTKVSEFLTACVREKMIECTSRTDGTSINICNYNKYQAYPSPVRTVQGVRVGQEPDTSRTDIKEGTRKEVEEGTSLSGGRDLAQEMAAIWNTECGDILPKAERMTRQRQQKFQGRLKDLGGELDVWRDICRRVRRSHFMTEQWHATIDWVLKPANLVKIQEGNYDDRATPLFGRGKQGAHDAETAAFERATRTPDDWGDDSSSAPPLLDAARAFG